jgi:hypothetical protein
VGFTAIHGSISLLTKFVPEAGWSPRHPAIGLPPETATAGPSLAAGTAPACGASAAAVNAATANARSILRMTLSFLLLLPRRVKLLPWPGGPSL